LLAATAFEFLNKSYPAKTIEPWGYPSVKISWSQLASFWYNSSLWRDRQTDGRIFCSLQLQRSA